jgi:predicted O-methyltransferase YrrM
MSDDLWTDVDRYISDLLIPPDPVLDGALAESEAAGLPAIAVSPPQGKFLNLIARLMGARKILEIGTLAGYSTIWLARALPEDGRLVTLESNEKHAAVARANFSRAKLDRTIELRLGRALDTLPVLAAEKAGPFDLVFIDADKENISSYFTWSLELSRAGTIIIVDNVIRNGAVIDAASTDSMVQGVRAFNKVLAAEPRVDATALQTVGSKGYDGFTMVLVTTVR